MKEWTNTFQPDGMSPPLPSVNPQSSGAPKPRRRLLIGWLWTTEEERGMMGAQHCQHGYVRLDVTSSVRLSRYIDIKVRAAPPTLKSKTKGCNLLLVDRSNPTHLINFHISLINYLDKVKTICPSITQQCIVSLFYLFIQLIIHVQARGFSRHFTTPRLHHFRMTKSLNASFVGRWQSGKRPRPPFCVLTTNT